MPRPHRGNGGGVPERHDIGGDRIDFLVLSAPAAPIFELACKDDVGGMLVGELVVHHSDCWPSGRQLRSRRRRTRMNSWSAALYRPVGTFGRLFLEIEREAFALP